MPLGNSSTDVRPHDAKLQPIVAGINLASTKLYYKNKNGTVNEQHTQIIEGAMQYPEVQGKFGIEYHFNINGTPFILRLPQADVVVEKTEMKFTPSA